MILALGSLRLQSSEGLSGARSAPSKLDHSHCWQFGDGFRLGQVGEGAQFFGAEISPEWPHNMMAGFH